MIFIIIVAFVLCVVIELFFPRLFCALVHPFKTVYYAVRDAVDCVKYKRYNQCPVGELVAFCGLFGRGKTLSAVHRICGMYERYNGLPVWCPRRKKMVMQRVKILSNVDLNIPYEKFVSLEQVVRASEQNMQYDDDHNALTVTLVLADEMAVQLNSRNFKCNINPLFLNSILTCRHSYISMYYTAQRFGQVDALLRQVTSLVYECDKLWRLQLLTAYDAWELENAQNSMLIKPIRRLCWFVRNADYNAYDTLAIVGSLKKGWSDGNMLTDAEILQLQCNTGANVDAIGKPSRLFKKLHKNKK